MADSVEERAVARMLEQLKEFRNPKFKVGM